MLVKLAEVHTYMLFGESNSFYSVTVYLPVFNQVKITLLLLALRLPHTRYIAVFKNLQLFFHFHVRDPNIFELLC